MRTLAQAEFQNSEIGSLRELPSVGSALENPYVYDSSARELKAMAEDHLLEIMSETIDGEGEDGLIRRFSFRRLR